jgi:hypothetical protein
LYGAHYNEHRTTMVQWLIKAKKILTIYIKTSMA